MGIEDLIARLEWKGATGLGDAPILP